MSINMGATAIHFERHAADMAIYAIYIGIYAYWLVVMPTGGASLDSMVQSGDSEQRVSSKTTAHVAGSIKPLEASPIACFIRVLGRILTRMCSGTT
jgi:hypothetical protein